MNDFFHRYFVERDAVRTLEMLSDEFYSIGTGEDEIAIGKEAFSKLLYTELEQLPDSILYTMTEYSQKERTPNSWDCFCKIDTKVSLPDGMQACYHIRLTAGLHLTETGFVIDMLHASEASKYQEEGEFFPLEFLSHGAEMLGKQMRHELMDLIGQTMPGGIMGGYMEQGFPLYVANERLLSMAGYDSYEEFEKDIQGQIINCIHPEDRGYINSRVDQLLDSGEQYEMEYRMKKKDGSYFWVHDIGRKTVDADGREVMVSVLIDFSQQVQTRDYLAYEAVTDPLTGIYNRKGAKNRITDMMKYASSYLFLMLDLDNFKRVNDIYGHKHGDEVLCFVAKQLTESFRKTDTICRLGGDEFAVFISDCENIGAIQQKVQLLIDTYQTTVQELWPMAGSTMSVGGICGYKNRTFIELYQAADEVLYEVKNGKKGEQKFRMLE